MKICHKAFFDGYRTVFGKLSQDQVDCLTFLLDAMQADPDINDYRWMAYMLATTKHETADTFRPIEEYGHGKGKTYGKPVKGKTYYGRGYVQITWRQNYRAFERLIGVPLVDQPELALVPEYAYRIMSIGMRKGIFTGRELARYINGGKCDYLLARKIINGTDKAQLIAGYAEHFDQILKTALQLAA